MAPGSRWGEGVGMGDTGTSGGDGCVISLAERSGKRRPDANEGGAPPGHERLSCVGARAKEGGQRREDFEADDRTGMAR
ncbi:hypothetical protein MFU01_03020 [Myxococcus fulvus]|uniref:Uncharacterized protein n=1 Tax=Myxococcus fulvus TaxID=33 RepID=A0A511STJ9_MYXFU|nr:hypothetical protein MFU01_03020 [Myxococcus fulvus]